MKRSWYETSSWHLSYCPIYLFFLGLPTSSIMYLFHLNESTLRSYQGSSVHPSEGLAHFKTRRYATLVVLVTLTNAPLRFYSGSRATEIICIRRY